MVLLKRAIVSLILCLRPCAAAHWYRQTPQGEAVAEVQADRATAQVTVSHWGRAGKREGKNSLCLCIKFWGVNVTVNSQLLICFSFFSFETVCPRDWRFALPIAGRPHRGTPQHWWRRLWRGFLPRDHCCSARARDSPSGSATHPSGPHF